jgi:hypothetical protein
VRSSMRAAASRVRQLYEGDERRPLQGYLLVMGTYGGLSGALAVAGRAMGAQLPDRFQLGDMVLLSIATHKASRLLAKDAITSPLRAPFTRYERPTGESELMESVRGQGAQHAAGELVSCPFCLAVWTSTALTAAMVFTPRATRLVCTILTAVAASDALQIAYDGGKQALHQAE